MYFFKDPLIYNSSLFYSLKMIFQQAVLNIRREHIIPNSATYEVILAVLFRDLQKLKY